MICPERRVQKPNREDRTQAWGKNWEGQFKGQGGGSLFDVSRDKAGKDGSILGFKLLLKSKNNEPKPNMMTFKGNKYKILHLGLKKVTYVSSAWKGSGGERTGGFSWPQACCSNVMQLPEAFM